MRIDGRWVRGSHQLHGTDAKDSLTRGYPGSVTELTQTARLGLGNGLWLESAACPPRCFPRFRAPAVQVTVD